MKVVRCDGGEMRFYDREVGRTKVVINYIRLVHIFIFQKSLPDEILIQSMWLTPLKNTKSEFLRIKNLRLVSKVKF